MTAPTGAPLDGWIVAVKELLDVAGVETTANTRVILPDAWRWPQHDAAAIARLRAAGAVIGPKTTTHEFAWGITTAQPDRERAVNPAAPGRVTGGSSGGAAAAVASGDARLAAGTDTGGSVRIPAAWCGVVGWKPTMGLIPVDGVLPLAPSLDHVGFLARDVETLAEVAHLFGVRPVPASDARFAVGRSDGIADRRSVAALDAMADVATQRGLVRRDDIALPPAAALVEAYRGIQMREALAVHRDLFGTWPSQRDRYAADVAPRLEAAERITAAEEIAARLSRERLRSAMLAHFADVDIVVAVTTGCAPPPVERPDVADVDGTGHALRDVVIAHTALANLVGIPAVSIPAGTGTPADDLRAVQLLGPPWSDGLLLEAARLLLDAATPA